MNEALLQKRASSLGFEGSVEQVQLFLVASILPVKSLCFVCGRAQAVRLAYTRMQVRQHLDSKLSSMMPQVMPSLHSCFANSK